MVLETTWDTPTGWAVVRDVLLIGPWRHDAQRSDTHQRVPTDHAAERVLLRTVRCFMARSTSCWNASRPLTTAVGAGEWRHTGEGYGDAEVSAADSGTGTSAYDRSEPGDSKDPGPSPADGCGRATRSFAPSPGRTGPPPATFSEAHERLARTSDFWHEWLSRGQFPDHPWRTYLQRSALTLKGLIYAPSGALLAASTSSLPETPGGERNYDYRYTWLRDSTFMLWGLYTLGFDREANDFFYFISDMAEGDADLQIMYGIGGERELTERTLDHLSGYDGARPVRIGNGAWDQRQHDMWGVLLDSVYLHTRSREALDDRRWPMLERQVETALAHWDEPDQGIWEVRGPAAPFHQLQGALLGGRGPRRQAGRPSRRPRQRRPLAPGGRGDPRRHLRPRHRRAGRVLRTTRPPPWTRRCC